MKKIRIILFLALIALVEIIIVAFAVWPASKKRGISHLQPLRLAVVKTEEGQPRAEEWTRMLKVIERDYGIPIHLYYANSHEEAIAGFCHGSLDMLYINPAMYLELQKKAQECDECVPVVIMRQHLPPKKLELNRSTIVIRGNAFLSQTQGLKMAYVNRNSMCGDIVPRRFLDLRLPKPQDKWFSKVTTVSHPKQGLAALNDRSANVIAGGPDLMAYLESSKERVLWTSFRLPQNLICLNENSVVFKDDAHRFLPRKIKELEQALVDRTKMHPIDLAESPFFVDLAGYEYKQELETLAKFLYSQDKELSPVEDEFIMNLGTENDN